MLAQIPSATMPAERVAATAAGAFVGTRCLPGMQLTGNQAQELCRGTTCPGDCAFWASGRTPTTTRQTARHTALFVGDSMARQLYVSTIAWLRGVAHNAATVDFGFQGTTLYLADGSGGEDAVVPLLVPLQCALARLDAAAAKERSECVAARERALDLTPQLYNSSGKPIITPLIYEMAVSQRRASAAVQRWTDQALAQWAGRASLRLLYVPSNGYVAAFWSALRQVDPHVVFAGALGAHVPCWSDGRAGHRCSIERVAEADHERFWDALLAATRVAGRLRRLVWLTQPVGSPHAGPYCAARTGRLPRLPTRHRRAWERALPGRPRARTSVRSPPGRPVTSLPAVGLPHASPTRLVEHRPVCAVRRPEVSGVERRGGGGPPARQPQPGAARRDGSLRVRPDRAPRDAQRRLLRGSAHGARQCALHMHRQDRQEPAAPRALSLRGDRRQPQPAPPGQRQRLLPRRLVRSVGVPAAAARGDRVYQQGERSRGEKTRADGSC